jgi:hypothetical protein
MHGTESSLIKSDEMAQNRWCDETKIKWISSANRRVNGNLP